MNPISQLPTTSNSQQVTDAYSGALNHQTQGANAPADTVSLGERTRPAQANGAAIPQEEVSLSPRAQRAQKIEAMADDFFSAGEFSIKDIPKLIQRLHQDGILSDSQLNRLSSAGFEIPEPNEASQSLLDFIDSKQEGLTQSEPDKALHKMLDDAKTVLNNMDSIDGALYSQTAARVSAQLTVLINADTNMPEMEKEQWQGLKSTMQLAASMGNSQQSSGQLSSYLALSKRLT